MANRRPVSSLILLLDDSARARWKSALENAAKNAGAHVETGPAPQTFEPELWTVVISDDVNWTVHIPAERSSVFSDGRVPVMPEAPGTFVDRHDLYKESQRLVVAAHIIRQGAVLYDHNIQEVDLEHIGLVTPGSKPRGSIENSPLSIYTRLPPRPGALSYWPSHLFSYQPEAFFDGAPDIDLTGRQRMILHGPYFFLPRGCWRATINLAVDPEGGVAPLRIQWGKDGDYATSEVRVESAGEYSITLEKEWIEPAAAQVVIWVMQPTFRGHLVFRGCSVKMRADIEA